jgi:hypothetical protein
MLQWIHGHCLKSLVMPLQNASPFARLDWLF